MKEKDSAIRRNIRWSNQFLIEELDCRPVEFLTSDHVDSSPHVIGLPAPRLEVIGFAQLPQEELRVRRPVGGGFLDHGQRAYDRSVRILPFLRSRLRYNVARDGVALTTRKSLPGSLPEPPDEQNSEGHSDEYERGSEELPSPQFAPGITPDEGKRNDADE